MFTVIVGSYFELYIYLNCNKVASIPFTLILFFHLSSSLYRSDLSLNIKKKKFILNNQCLRKVFFN